MDKDSLISLPSPEATGTFQDTLTEILRKGACQLIAQAVEEELQNFLAQYKDQRDKQGRKMVVRNAICQNAQSSQVSEKSSKSTKGTRPQRQRHKIQFLAAATLPKTQQEHRGVTAWLYLKGISTGDFQEALGSLLGEEASGLSPATISRLKQKWVGSIKPGNSVPCNKSAMCMCGQMGFISTSAPKKDNAFWCSSV